MTKADLVEQVTASIARTAGPMISKKDCARVVDAFLEAVKDALKDIELERPDAEKRLFGDVAGDPRLRPGTAQSPSASHDGGAA